MIVKFLLAWFLQNLNRSLTWLEIKIFLRQSDEGLNQFLLGTLVMTQEKM